MARSRHSTALLVAGLITALLFSVSTPLCLMPECTDVAVGSCSDFKPACDDCPEAAVMKHTPDDAVVMAAPTLGELTAIAVFQTAPEPVIVSVTLAAPAITASPPPLDPLGVRLTI